VTRRASAASKQQQQLSWTAWDTSAAAAAAALSPLPHQLQQQLQQLLCVSCDLQQEPFAAGSWRCPCSMMECLRALPCLFWLSKHTDVATQLNMVTN
jgi:hypothetical protein